MALYVSSGSNNHGIFLPTYAMMKNMSMHMGEYFYFSSTVKNFVFEGLNFDGTGGVVGVCVIIFIFTILLEATKSLTYYLTLRLNQNPLTYGRMNTSTSSSIQSDRSQLFSALMIPSSIAQIKRQRLKIHFSGYLLHTVNLIIGYLLMLAIMSFDAYILIAVILGSGVGYFIFGAVNARNKAKFQGLQMSLYDRYDSQAGLAVSEQPSTSSIS